MQFYNSNSLILIETKEPTSCERNISMSNTGNAEKPDTNTTSDKLDLTNVDTGLTKPDTDEKTDEPAESDEAKAERIISQEKLRHSPENKIPQTE